MRRLSLSISFISLTLSCVINAQIDPKLCPNGPTSSILDPRWQRMPTRFKINAELISENSVIELTQAFSPKRDAIMTNSKIGLTNFYWNFATNEYFEVVRLSFDPQVVPRCLRQAIQVTSETGVLMPKTLLLKPSVLLGFDSRNQANPAWGVQYDGDQVLHGIPVIRFKSCFYLYDIQATVAATYYTSDATKFQAHLEQNRSLILQIDVVVHDRLDRTESYQYNVFQYTPNPRREEEQQILEMPAGVYCPNRTSTLNVPKDLPDRHAANAEIYLSQANASVASSRNYYDTEFQFSRYDLWVPDPSKGALLVPYTELHDFSTGLSYRYSPTTHQCTVGNITLNTTDAVTVDGHPDLVQMSSVDNYFSMDDKSYQYAGEKPCRGDVWCHVWISEKVRTFGTIEQQEWYWSSSVNGEQTAKLVPVKTITKHYVNSRVSSTYEINIFNYHRDSNIFLESNQIMVNCYHAMGSENGFNIGIVSFTIANDNVYPVQQNMNDLRYRIWETLISSLSVRAIRISNIIVDRDNKDLLVTFTLLDVPPIYGPVEVPIKETLLPALIERFRAVIDRNELAFRLKYDNREVVLRARNNSLLVTYTNFEQNVTQCINPNTTTTTTTTTATTTTTITAQTPILCPDTTSVQSQNIEQHIDIVYKSSGPLITVFWIGFIILGLFIGVIGGFFASKRFSKQ